MLILIPLLLLFLKIVLSINSKSKIYYSITLFFFMFWALINVNSIVIVWELAGAKRLGTYTGLYYFFSALAAIVSPVVAGVLFDAIGIRFLFAYSIVFFMLAILSTLFIKTTGREEDKEE